MAKLFTHKIMVLLIIGMTAMGCTEQYVMQTNTFEDALVVEATLTNELKNQEVRISRTYRFEQDGPTFETGAEVYVTDDLGTRYDFAESGEKYISTTAFTAEAGKTYRLTIITSQGKRYESTTQMLTTVTNMENLTASVKVRDNQRGVAITASSFDPANTSKYYRYDYEETYKIVAPKWDSFKATVVASSPQDTVVLVPRDNTIETRTCYKTDKSNEIIQTTTSGLSEDRVNYDLRFISGINPIITHRYSILVRQYVQNLEAYTFYKTMKDLSGSGSILSQTQPGFFSGNITCTDNPAEKVIGFFEVASVSERRIFFNFTDLFPNDDQPPYFVDCSNHKFKFCFSNQDPECAGYALISAIGGQQLLYFDNAGIFYDMVLPPCGDCTYFASNLRPSFWTD
jgi:hypothetical protein